MIAGIDKIELDISKTLKKYNIEDVIEIRYSSIPNVDIQCNNLIKYSKNSDIKELKCAVHTCLSKNSFIESIEITDKNFINMRLSSEYLKKYSKNHVQ